MHLSCLPQSSLQQLANVAAAGVCSTERLRGKARHNISKASISMKSNNSSISIFLGLRYS